MSIFRNHLPIMGASGQSTGYEIDQSIRFNSADSAYMHRTPSSSGNRKKFTSSFWVKFADLTDCALPMPSVAQNASYGAYLSSGVIQFFIYYTGSAWQGQLYTNRVFRDPSAWYHFVIAVDTTQAVSTERVRIYVNGLRETSFSTENYPNQNQDTDWNNSGEKMGIGVNANGFSGSFGEYYAAEMNYLDGYAYGPEYFGEFKTDTDIWIPKEYTGSYGTNGFKIDGRDSGDLGDDESGNGNDFTTVGLAAHDQMADSPTNIYAVMNPLDTHSSPNWTLSNGNLDVSCNGANYTNHLFSTLSMPSTGKWYFEFKWVSDSSQVLYYQQLRLGIMDEDINAAYIQANTGVQQTLSGGPEFIVIPGSGSGSSFQGDGANLTSFFSSFSMGDVLNFARDGTKLWVGKNGTYYNSGDPANGTNATSSALELKGYRANMHWTQTSSSHGTAVVHAFFGADKSIGSGTGFNNTVPTGFKALNTINLGEA